MCAKKSSPSQPSVPHELSPSDGTSACVVSWVLVKDFNSSYHDKDL